MCSPSWTLLPPPSPEIILKLMKSLQFPEKMRWSLEKLFCVLTLSGASHMEQVVKNPPANAGQM